MNDENKLSLTETESTIIMLKRRIYSNNYSRDIPFLYITLILGLELPFNLTFIWLFIINITFNFKIEHNYVFLCKIITILYSFDCCVIFILTLFYLASRFSVSNSIYSTFNKINFYSKVFFLLISLLLVSFQSYYFFSLDNYFNEDLKIIVFIWLLTHYVVLGVCILLFIIFLICIKFLQN